MSVTKHLSQNNIIAKVQHPGSDTDCTSTLRTEYSHIAVVVDLQCKGSLLFLSHVSLDGLPKQERRSKTNRVAVSLSVYTHTHINKPTACEVIVRLHLSNIVKLTTTTCVALLQRPDAWHRRSAPIKSPQPVVSAPHKHGFLPSSHPAR